MDIPRPSSPLDNARLAETVGGDKEFGEELWQLFKDDADKAILHLGTVELT